MNITTNRWRTITLGVGAIFWSAGAEAFKLTPMSIVFEPMGPGATKSFMLENDSREKTAVQLSMTERKMALDGHEDRPSAEGQFQIYPQQLVLQPGEKRAVRVSWTGGKELGAEQAFRIIAEQLPVEGLKAQAGSGAQIQILLKYEGSVYVTPATSAALLAVETAELVSKGADAKLALTLANTGTRHQILVEPKIFLSAGDSHLELSGETLKDLNGHNVLAGARRKFLIAWPKEIPQGPIQARIEVGK